MTNPEGEGEITKEYFATPSTELITDSCYFCGNDISWGQRIPMWVHISTGRVVCEWPEETDD